MVRQGAVQDSLSRKPKPEVARPSGHDPNATHYIMVNLTAASINVVIHRREVMFHIDPLRDHQRGGQNRF